MQAINKREIGNCILLSILTFGIYAIYWKYLLVKNTRTIQKDESSCTGEMLCLLFVPLYSTYWWFTRGKIVREKFTEHGYSVVGNENAYLTLGIFGQSIISMVIMQNDFNSFRPEPVKSNQRSTSSIPYCPPTVSAQSAADELKKYKDLKDRGFITEEEFQTKKEQLLKLM